ncbi:twin-arginine translocation signal domain-containing protein [Halobacterium zhouii]|uniref:twin-arginine translocation signal domain-containing protein n=1 Tax=Halobacterium zhouii TaxID=2902624 RepID=UPI001E366859|nr:twin-arginine translocation signal domain-containing protein [Halobacterium zhouii]
MDRRKFIKTAGAVTAGLTLAGCAGTGENSNPPEGDTGDEPVNDESPGWFNTDLSINEERMGQEVEITQSSLFRTSESFGVRFTVKNKSGAPLTNVTVHVRMMGPDGDVLDEWTTALAEVESIGDLAQNETWQGDVLFEETDPSTILNQNVSFDIWATAEGESGAGVTETTTSGG